MWRFFFCGIIKKYSCSLKNKKGGFPVKKKNHILVAGIIFLLLWPLFVLYPNPAKIFTSFSRLLNPPVNYYVEEIKPLLKKTYNKSPREIEIMVKKEIPYEYDWVTSNLPWYFPTVEEVLQRGKGDCKSRLLVMASIFEFYKIPYSIYFSPTHIWIDYERKPTTKIESKDIAIASSGKGGVRVRVPKIDFKTSSSVIKRSFWNPMPKEKKIFLFLGSIFFLFFVFIPEKKEKELLSLVALRANE